MEYLLLKVETLKLYIALELYIALGRWKLFID